MDAIVVGGGLAGSLLAYRLATKGSVLLVEKGQRLGGNHTWCLHDSDLMEDSKAWLQPLFTKSWASHEVRFPQFHRKLEAGYHALQSQDLHRQVMDRLGERVLLGLPVEILSDTQVERDGVRLDARVVIDARGYGSPENCGYQKFLGQDWKLDKPHGLDGPILMDATCPQWDGYRFIYVLPWDSHRLLVEDTRYSDSCSVDVEGSRLAIANYVREHWGTGKVEREEVGSLPIPLYPEPLPTGPGVKVGMAAGLYHPTTGYSFPRVVETVQALTSVGDFDPFLYRRRVRSLREELPEGFFCFLNRLLFRGAVGKERRQIFERFYRLGEKQIARFYRGNFHWGDRLRLFLGKPPIPVTRAWSVIRSPSLQTTEELS